VTIASIAAMLGNRVAKNLRRLAPWTKQHAVTCYRVYDQDIPEIPITVDTYEGHVVVADVRRWKEQDDPGWLDAMLGAIAPVLDTDVAAIRVKRRERMRRAGLTSEASRGMTRHAGAKMPGARQYERLGDAKHEIEVGEGGHRFLVNLDDYLDTGLFLDHRTTRGLVAAEAAGKHVLNLYCYTAAFTVYAARAGAATSTSVDLSNTYVEWAGRNFARNGLDDGAHRRVHADVREFLGEARRAGRRWDLAIVDPPTFSNSARMDYTFDVQRDHAALLADVANVIGAGGVIWFSTNRHRFRLDGGAFPTPADVVNRTADTIPPDFRDRRIHQAWRIAL
jgi:23S rRNA G2069 N7-methylase RlmK/C1962 C5-methylase RlmI